MNNLGDIHNGHGDRGFVNFTVSTFLYLLEMDSIQEEIH